MKRPILTLLCYYVLNDLIADLTIGRKFSLLWIAVAVFGVTSVLYAIEYLHHYRIPAHPIKPWMKQKWWIAVELFTAVTAVLINGLGAWYFGYRTVHFGLLLTDLFLLLPTALHIEAIGAHHSPRENPMNDEALK